MGVEILGENKSYSVGNISFTTPIGHIHGVETYGLNIFGNDCSISIITDSEYFEGLESYYKGDILIINVVLFEERSEIRHLKSDIPHMSRTRTRAGTSTTRS